MRAARWAVLGLSLWSKAALAEEGWIFLAELPTEAAPGLSLSDPKATLRLQLNALFQPEFAQTLLRRSPPARLEGPVLVLDSLEYGRRSDAVTPADTAASFVIDFDQPSFTALRAEAVKQLGPKPEIAALARFVDAFIATKSYARGYDVASKIAVTREGDCTEHAVLLAAAARSFGIPARVVNGLLLLEHGGRVRAVGHAWVEHHQGQSWERVDALESTLRQGPTTLRYVPLGVLDGEGPNFLFHLMGQLGPAHIAKVVLARRAK